ncbi:tetratricopeptide repeat protein 16 isoform X3 [Oreochromis niloticus]|uniref:tetratricopeptide repeat protein 16 isoform X3 n=1 Tax=Oreochromis niloticus TaxID=8128 RepID=UPI00039447AC|nr:tetratricopeptide repeat protein 16 isoform X3 [Oreochromis niloticus]
MDTSEETDDQTDAEQSFFPTAVSEEELVEAKRKSTLKRLFGSSKIFLHTEKSCQRPDLQGSLIIQSKAAEHYTNGEEAMGKSQYERAVTCFSKAITLKPQQVQLYVSQAEAYLQLCDFQSAAACYKQAWLLEPGAFRDRLAFIYYLQGQCLFDQGFFVDALEAFSKAAEVKPGCRAHKVRSLACLTASGHHTDCLKLVNDWMASEGPTSDLYILRARLHKELNKTSVCYHDVRLALALNPTCPMAGALQLQLREASEQARQRAVDKALCGELPEALCMINIALANSPEDARLYLFRGTLYRRMKNFIPAIEDIIQAVELSGEEEKEGPQEIRSQKVEVRDDKAESCSVQEEAQFQLALIYNDFAVQCFCKGLYAEATLLLNKAIEEEKGQAGLYLNRGGEAVTPDLSVYCFFKQSYWYYALADYRQAEEMMQPNDPAVRLRLAVIYNTLGSLCFQDGRFQEAVSMFSLAIQHNPASSRYYESRSKAFRKLLNLSGARQDFICMLILDPTHEEVAPMLMSLFPGCRVSDVLSSPKGQAIRAQLMETMQECSSSSDPQRLSEKLCNMTLTNESAASQSKEPSEEGKELELCVNKEDMQITQVSCSFLTLHR